MKDNCDIILNVRPKQGNHPGLMKAVFWCQRERTRIISFWVDSDSPGSKSPNLHSSMYYLYDLSKPLNRITSKIN